MNNNELNEMKQFISGLVLGSAQSYVNNILEIVKNELGLVNGKIDGVITLVPLLQSKLYSIESRLDDLNVEPNELW